MSEERVKSSSPKELEPYEKAYRNKLDMIDQQMWVMGQYVASAIGCSFNKNGEYPKTPIRQSTEFKLQNGLLTEEEEMKIVEGIFASLDVMANNFERNKKNKEKETQNT